MRHTKRLVAAVRRPVLATALAGLLAGLLSLSCVGGNKGLSSDDKERLKANVLDAVPADLTHKMDVNFENKVHLVGYRFEPELAHPGQESKLTYYWRCDDTLDDGWLLFTHTKDEVSGKMGNLDFTGPLREEKNGHQLLGPEHWEKGKVYVDQQTYKVPDDVQGDVVVYVGIWKGDARLRIISGPNDGDNSAIVGKIKTGVVAKQAEEHTSNDVPSLIVNQLTKAPKITVDGKADEPEWGAAAGTGPFVDVGTGKANPSFPVGASAKVLWDDKTLYLFFQVDQADFYTGFADAKSQPKAFTAAGQPKLWEQDTIEMMVDPDPSGDARDYYELQINPQNKVFKSQFDTLQQPNGGPNGPFGHEDWDPKLKSAVQVRRGPDGKTAGYNVEVAIPWAAYAKAANHPPKSGDVWRINFYGMHNNGGVAFSPILGQGNFHNASRFARVTWVIPGAPPAASAPAPIALPGFFGDAGRNFPRLAMPMRHPPMRPQLPSDPQQPPQPPHSP
jgi:Carbohydrate family 9 binding domain-like